MSNEVYDEFCLASIPNLTQLDRQLLGHYCTRFNETVVPPRAWPSLTELKRLTGAHEKSISRSIGRLNRQRLLIRVTLANKERGLKAQYAVNRKLIRSFIQVTEELPIQDVSNLEVTEETLLSNSVVPLSNPTVTEKEPHGYPKPNEPNKPKNVINEERFNNLILNNLPKELRSKLNAGQNYEEQLDELERLRVSENRIREAFNLLSWHEVYSVGGAVSKSLADLVTEAIRFNSERERVAEENRLRAEQNAERERLKVPPEIAELWAKEAREGLRRGTP